jgi:predicted phosphate transport protein (TIGR00153 family)
MFDWFRRLIPRSGDFFALFERHSKASVSAAETLAKLVRGEGDRTALVAEIRDREHDADDVIREVLSEVRKTFLTPFDRGAIIGLIGAMDDTIDEIHACASAIETYEFAAFEPDMKVMAEKICRAMQMIDKALPLLRDLSRSGDKLHELTGAIVAVEGEVDVIHTRGLKTNYARARSDGDTVGFIVSREIFKHLEKVADAFEDVANHIDGIVIDYA